MQTYAIFGDQSLAVHDHNRPVYVFGYNPKTRSKHADIVDAAADDDAPKTG